MLDCDSSVIKWGIIKIVQRQWASSSSQARVFQQPSDDVLIDGSNLSRPIETIRWIVSSSLLSVVLLSHSFPIQFCNLLSFDWIRFLFSSRSIHSLRKLAASSCCWFAIRIQIITKWVLINLLFTVSIPLYFL